MDEANKRFKETETRFLTKQKLSSKAKGLLFNDNKLIAKLS